MRPIDSSDILNSAAILAEAFSNDPLYMALAPNADARRRWLLWVMGVSVRLSWRFGGAYELEATSARLCLIPPGHCPMSLCTHARAVRGIPPLASAGPWLTRGLAAQRWLHDHHHRDPHFCILAIGVAPNEHGRGHGGRLLRGALALAKQRGLACYLETASEKNVSLYRHFGFEVTAEYVTAGLPKLWTMSHSPA